MQRQESGLGCSDNNVVESVAVEILDNKIVSEIGIGVGQVATELQISINLLKDNFITKINNIFRIADLK